MTDGKRCADCGLVTPEHTSWCPSIDAAASPKPKSDGPWFKTQLEKEAKDTGWRALLPGFPSLFFGFVLSFCFAGLHYGALGAPTLVMVLALTPILMLVFWLTPAAFVAEEAFEPSDYFRRFPLVWFMLTADFAFWLVVEYLRGRKGGFS